MHPLPLYSEHILSNILEMLFHPLRQGSSHFQFQNILHYMALYDHYLHVPAPNQFRHLGLYQPLHLSTLQDLLHLVHFPVLNYIHKQSQNLLRLQRLQSLQYQNWEQFPPVPDYYKSHESVSFSVLSVLKSSSN